MAHKSFARDVLSALTKLALANGGEAAATDISHFLFIQTRKGHKRMLNTLSDLVKSGRARRVRQGVYAPVLNTGKPDKREVMWRLLRMRKSVTIGDLQELANVSHDYAKEWLEMLTRREIVTRIAPQNTNKQHSWRLIKTDLVEMPIDTEKAERLRALRKKKKAQVVVSICRIEQELEKIRTALHEDKEE